MSSPVYAGFHTEFEVRRGVILFHLSFYCSFFEVDSVATLESKLPIYMCEQV